MSRTIIIISGVIALIVAVEAVRLVQLVMSIKGNAHYWQERAAAPVPTNAFIYVALGDSVAQGLGATSPARGYVGLVAADIAKRTGRPVHVVNISVTGAKVADVVATQLPQLANLKPDLVTLDIGANDAHRNVDGASFERDYATILAALPGGKTVVADLPPFAYRDEHGLVTAWNPFVRTQITSHGLILAPVYDKLTPYGHNPLILGADFFHPSNTGYKNAWYAAFKPGVEQVVPQT